MNHGESLSFIGRDEEDPVIEKQFQLPRYDLNHRDVQIENHKIPCE